MYIPTINRTFVSTIKTIRLRKTTIREYLNESRNNINTKKKTTKAMPYIHCYVALFVMEYPLKGTLKDLMEFVPTKVLGMMVSQNRDENYIFNIDVQNGFLLVW